MYGWCAAIRGVEGGGLVEGLPAHNFCTDEGDVAMKCPTEVADHRPAREGTGRPRLHSAGALQGHATTRRSSASSPRRSRRSTTRTAANANARLSAQLPYIFACSRFAHYLKAMMRDKIGSFMSRKDCENFLNNWITNYVTPDDTATPSIEGGKAAAGGADRRRRSSWQARRVSRRRVPAAALPAG